MNMRLRDDLKAVEAHFQQSLAAKIACKREIQELKARIAVLEKPPGGHDLEAMQTEFNMYFAGIRTLTDKVGKTKMRLCLVPEHESSEQSKCQRT